MSNTEGSMTLAFDLTALEHLADPEAVFQDARAWSEYIGIVSEKPTFAVTKFAREHRIRQDFFSGPRGRQESLEQIRGQFETDRHVFIGTKAEDATLAEEVGWEYLPIEEAASSADWRIRDEPST